MESVLPKQPLTSYMKNGEEMDQSAGAKRILVLDNDEIMRIAIRFMLERAGYKVYLAEHGDEAIDSYRKALNVGHPFDAVILDWNIRGGKGARETVGKLLELDSHAKAVVTSCDRTDPVTTHFREYGFRGVLVKPFTSDELEQTVHTAVYGPWHIKNILLVDDNPYFLTGLSMNLCVHLKNCNILTAGNGRQALEIMKAVPVDLIVTDLEMPFMDGYELVESVKKKHRGLPVFAMTGSASPETKKRLESMGVSRCIEKPFGFKELADLIETELGCSLSAAA
jgi:CheY-like chemotaxis protein